MSVQGIDISQAQVTVDFKKVSIAGIKFVIIRSGYGNALAYPKQIDSSFTKHYNGAKSAGLDVGSYWFSYADSPEAARAEARSCLSVIKGKKFEYPIFFDIENAWQFYKGKEFCDSIIEAFCSELTAAGYYVGVYCSTWWYTNYVSEKVRSKYPCWIAQWGSKCTYTGKYDMWQDNAVLIDGVQGAVDHDICYVDYPSIIKNKGLNGYTVPTPSISPSRPKKTVEELAAEVWLGKWGAGAERMKRLTAAGYNYNAVQKRVNEMRKK